MEKKDVIKFHARKTFRGLVSVRSKTIDLAKSKGLPILLTCSEYPNEQMLIEDLSEDGAHSITSNIKSSINDDVYSLYNYVFENNYE